MPGWIAITLAILAPVMAFLIWLTDHRPSLIEQQVEPDKEESLWLEIKNTGKLAARNVRFDWIARSSCKMERVRQPTVVYQVEPKVLKFTMDNLEYIIHATWGPPGTELMSVRRNIPLGELKVTYDWPPRRAHFVTYRLELGPFDSPSAALDFAHFVRLPDNRSTWAKVMGLP